VHSQAHGLCWRWHEGAWARSITRRAWWPLRARRARALLLRCGLLAQACGAPACGRPLLPSVHLCAVLLLDVTSVASLLARKGALSDYQLCFLPQRFA
jgi:hypothetical protein